MVEINPHDFSIIALTNPKSGCGLGIEQVKLQVKNTGIVMTDSINYKYSINGGTYVNQMDTTKIQVGDTINFTFTQTADLHIDDSIYTFTIVGTRLYGSTLIKDSIIVPITNAKTISTFPYHEQFTAGANGWYAKGNLTPSLFTWALGNPHKTVINHGITPTDTVLWVTNLTGAPTAADNSSVISPCLDFVSGSLLHPMIEFDIWYELGSPLMPNTQLAKLEFSKDNGTTWKMVGYAGEPFNWYNSTSGWQGNTGNYVHVKHNLDSLIGINNGKIRITFINEYLPTTNPDGVAFGNIKIYEKPANDLATINITSPTHSCGLTSAETIIATVVNYGTADQSNFLVRYKLDNHPIITDTFVGMLTPVAGPTLFTFTVKGDFSAVGAHYLTVWTDLPTDADRSNDTAKTIIYNSPKITTFPWFNNFDTNTGYFMPKAFSSWQCGNPATAPKPIIDSASSAPRAWVTDTSANVPDGEKSYIISPCFDFTNLTNPTVEFDIWHDINAASFSSVKVMTSKNGGQTWQIVGANGGGTNWYNGTTLIIGWIGSSNGYKHASHQLDGLAGESNVNIGIFYIDSSMFIPQVSAGVAIDNFKVKDCPLPDASIVVGTITGADVPLTGNMTGQTSYIWYFGDGTTNTSQTNPTHHYAADGPYTVSLVAINACGKDSVTQQVNISWYSVDEYNSNFITCTPNPSNGNINISFNDASINKFSLKLYSVTGEMIYDKNFTNNGIFNNQFDFSYLSKGIYFLKLETQKQNYYKKLIIK